MWKVIVYITKVYFLRRLDKKLQKEMVLRDKSKARSAKLQSKYEALKIITDKEKQI